MVSDNDEIDLPLSSRRALERADHGRKERRELKEKRERLSRTGGARLLLTVLRKITGFSLPKNGTQPDQTGKTLTLKEQEEQSRERANEKPSPENVLQRAAEQRADMQKAEFEQQGNADA